MKYLILMLLTTSSLVYAKYSNESELSLVQTGGNSSVETYNAKTLNKWEGQKRLYTVNGHYTLGMSEQNDEKVESARNWSGRGKYEQVLTEHINGFASLQYEGDEFAGYKQRENTDLGGKYIITKSDRFNSFAELGFRYTTERRTSRNDDNEDTFNFSKGRAYYEIAVQLHETLSYKLWIEYLPNFTEPEDYMINFEPSISVMLSQMFSLKTAYKAMYDNVPNIEGNKYTDYTFTTSILAKF
jgi:putative salt-induced outer membrane protein